jgi:regulatory protein
VPAQPRGPAQPDRAPTPRPGGDGDPVAAAHALALRRLSAAPLTRQQLAQALRRRGVPEPAAAQVLDRLEAVSLIDDEAFATAWVHSRHRSRGLARRALAAELRTRGVAGETVDAAVAGLDRDEELATARTLVARRSAATANLAPAVQARRLLALLARKGYPPAVAARVVREHLDAVAQRGDADVEPATRTDIPDIPDVPD